jgi:Tfp pilus assembly protein PilZ
MASDKRTSVRQPYTQEVEFEAMIAGAKKAGLARHRAHCLDISQGGLGITTAFKPREGEILRLSIPIKREVTLPVFAEVMWITPEGAHFRAGMRFLS